MPFNEYWALIAFAFVMAFTPGPNNIMLAASGVNFGFTRSIPHLAGVVAGFAILVAACAAGLGLVFAAFPMLQLVLKVAGALYMLWLAYRVATAHRSDAEGAASASALTFWQAALFQWINPKGLVAALSAVAIYVRPGHERQDIFVMLIIFTVTTVLSAVAWTAFGVSLRNVLRDPTRARVFNVSMAVLLVASIVPMVA